MVSFLFGLVFGIILECRFALLEKEIDKQQEKSTPSLESKEQNDK